MTLKSWRERKRLSIRALALIAGCDASRVRETDRFLPTALPERIMRVVEQIDGPEVAAAVAAAYVAERAARAVEVRRALAAT